MVKGFLSRIHVQMYEKLLKGRIIIDLNTVDHSKQTIYEAMGIDAKTFDFCVDYIFTKYTPAGLAEKFGLKEKKMMEALSEAYESENIESKIITKWWKGRGRKKITLEEFVGTYLLLDFIKSYGPLVVVMIPARSPSTAKKMTPRKQKDLFYVS